MNRSCTAVLALAVLASPVVALAAADTVTAWVRLASENQDFSVPGTRSVRYGDGWRWAPVKKVSGAGNCGNAFFGGDPAWGAGKFCEVQVTAPAVTQVPGQMPVINKGLLPKEGRAYANSRVRALTPEERAAANFQPNPSDVGSFRTPCEFSHFSADDPIVFPGQPGVSHFHTFVGNTRADANSTTESLMAKGDSTCAGGIANRTAYWMPSLVDTRTGQPLVPMGTNFYYKLGYLGVKAGTVQPFPKGLRMIAGDSRLNRPVPSFISRFSCVGAKSSDWQSSIPSCAVGDHLVVSVVFPQCWDGRNLDSPDHKSHMAYGTGQGCPATHPVPLPEVTLNVHYVAEEPRTGEFWRLSSDNYAGPGGYSLHADWFGAWDVPTMKAFIANCINGNQDCHDFLLGDGRMIF